MPNSHAAHVLQEDAVPKSSIISDDIPDIWKNACTSYSREIHRLVHDIIEKNKESLSNLFYDHMMKESSASFFLSDQIVNAKLHHTMQVWMSLVFSSALNESYDEAVNYQKKIGTVHARIGIPTHLVMRGARALNQGIIALLSDIDVRQHGQAIAYAVELTNLAVEIMCQAYATLHERDSRTEESYRLFAISQNISSEKERQRASLLDWENQLMFAITISKDNTDLPKISHAEFGLWFLHKAAHIFEGSQDVLKIQALIEHIDSIIDQIKNHTTDTDNISAFLEIREEVKSLSYLLNKIFEEESVIEAGRDSLTNLLNRKYLHVIMSREISYARKHHANLTTLALDIDFFKQINDTYGHDAGDSTLQRIAALMFDNVRGSDYVFRMGGEEFLIVMPDTDIEQAEKIAEKLRKRVQQEQIVLSDNKQINITISIGVATHRGHPDYMRLLKEADVALYHAKNNGRNRVSSYPTIMHEVA